MKVNFALVYQDLSAKFIETAEVPDHSSATFIADTVFNMFNEGSEKECRRFRKSGVRSMRDGDMVMFTVNGRVEYLRATENAWENVPALEFASAWQKASTKF